MGTIVGLLLPLIYAVVLFDFATHFSLFSVPFSVTVLLYASYGAIALMVLATIVLFLGYMKGEIESRTSAFSITALLAYSVINFPGDFAYTTFSNTTFTTVSGFIITGIGPVEYLVFRLFGYWPVGSIVYDALLVLASIALILAIYLLGRLTLLRNWAKLFIALTFLSVAADNLSLIYNFYLSYHGLYHNSLFNIQVYFFVATLQLMGLVFSLALPITCFLLYSLHRKNSGKQLHGIRPEDLQNSPNE